MTDRWVVWVGTAVAAVMLLALGDRWWAVAVVLLGGFVSSRFGPPQLQLDPVRLFPEDVRRTVWEEARGLCQKCGRLTHFEGDCRLGDCPDDYQCDHVEPWSKGGRTVLSNAACLCRRCNQEKSNH